MAKKTDDKKIAVKNVPYEIIEQINTINNTLSDVMQSTFYLLSYINIHSKEIKFDLKQLFSKIEVSIRLINIIKEDIKTVHIEKSKE